jgi:hypothetical protein
MAKAEASRAKLKDEKKKAKVQGSNSAVISPADSKEGSLPSAMSCLRWNCRGLGNTTHRELAKKVCPYRALRIGKTSSSSMGGRFERYPRFQQCFRRK